jgi:hypothetical protein
VTDDRQVRGYRDGARKLLKTFGRLRGLWRAFAGVMEVIRLLQDGDQAYGLAFAIQPAKCLCQVALGRGDWQNGLLFLPIPDAIGSPSFGGEEAELSAIQSYRKASQDLKGKVGQKDKDKDVSEQESDNGDEDGPGKKRKKGKEKEAFTKGRREGQRCCLGAAVPDVFSPRIEQSFELARGSCHSL